MRKKRICADLPEHVHTECENNFCVDVDDRDDRVDFGVSLKSVSVDFTENIKVNVVVKLVEAVDWFEVGTRWRQQCRRALTTGSKSSNVDKSRVAFWLQMQCEVRTGTRMKRNLSRIKEAEGSRRKN